MQSQIDQRDMLNVKIHYTLHQKMKFPIKNFFSKCGQICSFLRVFFTYTEEFLNGKFHFFVQCV